MDRFSCLVQERNSIPALPRAWKTRSEFSHAGELLAASDAAMNCLIEKNRDARIEAIFVPHIVVDFQR